MSFRIKNTLATLILTLLILVASLGYLHYHMAKLHQQQVQHQSQWLAKQLIAQLQQTDQDASSLKQALQALIKRSPLLQVRLLDDNQRVLVEANTTLSQPVAPYTFIHPWPNEKGGISQLALVIDTSQIAPPLPVSTSLGVAMSIWILSGVIAFFISSAISRQLEDLKQGAILVQTMGPGHQLPELVNHELSEVTQAFNRMSLELANNQQSLQSSNQQQQKIATIANKNTALNKAILSASLDGIITIDHQSKIIEYNLQAQAMFGWSREEMLGQSLTDRIIPPEFREAHTKGMKHYMASGEGPVFGRRLELVALHKDGHTIPIEIAISPIRYGGEALFTAFIRDISERLEAEQELKLAAHAFDSIEPMFITDAQGTILRSNRAFSMVTGFSAEEAIGQNARLLSSGKHDPAFYREMWRALLQNGQWHGEIYNQRKNGEIYPEHLTITAVKDADLNVSHYIAHFIDISAQKKNEARLKQARQEAEQASEAKSRFLATMSHEIRSPLNAIIAMTDMLLESELNAEQQELAQLASQGGHTLMALINNILDFSKIESDHLVLQQDWFSLQQTAEAVVTLLAPQAQQKDIALCLAIDPDLKQSYFGDPLRLSQVLINLISNAIKFTEQGGVAVTISIVRQQGIDIQVRDTGIGISEADQANIFSEFVQAESSSNRRFGGSGLGLAISQRIIELMDGTIEVASTLGQGSVFTVWLPLQASKDAELVIPIKQRGNPHQLHFYHAIDNQVLIDSLTKQLAWFALPLIDIRSQSAKLEQPSLVFIDNDLSGQRRQALSIENTAQLEFINLLPLDKQTLFHTQRPEGYQGSLALPIKLNSLVQLLGSGSVTKHHLHAHQVEANPSITASPNPQHILLVEDSPTNQAVAKALLKKINPVISVAENGKDAVQQCKQQKFALILMDLAMPVMDGLTATEMIRNGAGLNQQTPIIAMTANAFAEDKNRCYQVGMNDFLSKPLDKDVFRSTVLEWLTLAASVNDPDEQPTAQPTQEQQAEPAAESTQAAPVSVNKSTLKQLKKDIPTQVLNDILAIFSQESEQRIADIHHHYQQQDWRLLEIEAHSLKSSAGSFGLEQLQQLAKAIEDLSHQQQASDLAPYIEKLAHVFNTSQQDLQLALAAMESQDEKATD
ncbi:PAS domain S-box protein [Motilimonas eburnea]|uniref:PAS domain S-box protein n=1 Tax=Motilimonas eburnea TaxID=1737488 RepID=UPI001E651E4D|nr:PAS domain S-box protein [Motilimonas eburnea]MCE2570760.1 PAS domain S-box protein [Motilimonas eburnea]